MATAMLMVLLDSQDHGRFPDCISYELAETVTDRLNKAFESRGHKDISSSSAPELGTAGYPTGDNCAINNGTGHTTAVDASCDHCDKTSLRNVQISGNRGDRTITTGGCSIPLSFPQLTRIATYGTVL
ncbi:hypothetical protein GGG16DRAFT_112980 [Schizophyllum commune]